MGGGLLQLVAYGAQDVFLTGNPQITFFKVVYRRHTNFSMEAIEQSFNGNNVLGSSVSVHITRNGDLIHRIYFNAKLLNDVAPNSDGVKTCSIALVPYFGQRLLKTIELEIGGQRVDKHYAEWLYIWNELTLPPGKKEGYQLMVGGERKNRSRLLRPQESHEIYVPLEFWFCRNIGLALPLIALQYHEVKLNFTYATSSELVDKNGNISDVLDETTAVSDVDEQFIPIGTLNNDSTVFDSKSAHTNLKLQNVSLWVDYIFLDTDERRRFAQQSHEYLVEQLQFPGPDSITASSSPEAMKSIKMVFNHPCKEIIWTIKGSGTNTYWNNFSDNGDNLYEASENPVLRAKIQLNGNDRFTDRKGTYFNTVQPYQHHECTPSIYHNGINVYSFALKPEEHQPSGSLNMSRIDTAMLSVSSSINGTICIYAVNYNVLRILSGMGALAYSN
jgi:hypothetical protein